MAQTMYVWVRDNAGLPVVGAIPYLPVHMSAGERIFKLPPTDDIGVSRAALPLEASPGVTILIDVEVKHPSGFGNTRTSVISWW